MKWKDISCSQIKIINIVKMAIVPKEICKFNVIPIKIFMTFFTELEQIILKPQKTWNFQNNHEEKKYESILLKYFQLYYKATKSKKHSIGTKANIQINGKELKAQK